VEVPNPVSGRVRRVDLAPEDVHTIVFWSKDFSRFLEISAEFAAYNLHFLFTVNNSHLLEPNLPPLPRRIDQVRRLADRYGADRIGWRFDPVVLWNNGAEDNSGDFEKIARSMASTGVGRCYLSFVDLYRKVVSRARRVGIEFHDPPQDKKIEIASRLAEIAVGLGITVYGCCEANLTESGVLQAGGCIDGSLLSRLADEPCSTAGDRSQRPHCRCTNSIDIGDYRGMPCSHSCLYCYANPAIDEGRLLG
jgi:DNA repair photolyase